MLINLHAKTGSPTGAPKPFRLAQEACSLETAIVYNARRAPKSSSSVSSRNPNVLPIPRSSASGTNAGHRDSSSVKSPIRKTRSRTP